MGIALQLEGCPAANGETIAEKRLQRDDHLLPAKLPARAPIDSAGRLLEPARGDIFGTQRG